MLPAPPHWATSWPPGRSTAARWRKSASWSATQWSVAVERAASTTPSIGAPVLVGGSVVAAVCLLGPIERLTTSPGEKFAAAVVEAARRIEKGG